MKNNNKIEKLYLTGEVYILAFAVLGVVLVFSDFWIGVIQLSLAVISLVLNFILKKISRKRLNAMIEKGDHGRRRHQQQCSAVVPSAHCTFRHRGRNPVV